jgi:hypothetical protein
MVNFELRFSNPSLPSLLLPQPVGGPARAALGTFMWDKITNTKYIRYGQSVMIDEITGPLDGP